jgi:amino acid adenylation domain-containing protein
LKNVAVKAIRYFINAHHSIGERLHWPFDAQYRTITKTVYRESPLSFYLQGRICAGVCARRAGLPAERSADVQTSAGPSLMQHAATFVHFIRQKSFLPSPAFNRTQRFNVILLSSLDLRRHGKFDKICPEHEEFMSDLYPSNGEIKFDHMTADASPDRDEQHYSLTGPERNKLLFEWNQTRTQYPRDTCVHQLFEAQVERSPHAMAVECKGHHLTYQQLNARANQLAHHLRSLGAGPEALVGICVEPSLDLVIGLLGILKAGGAYVPLDPAYPKERLAFMLKDTAMKVLVAQQKLMPELPPGSAQIVFVEAPLASPDSASTNPASGVSSDNLAYVIYTSGSTGRPKGVMIPHRGLVNYLVWATDAYQVVGGKGAPVHSSISFDLTITGLFAPLLVGRCVYMLPPKQGVETLGSELLCNQEFSLVKITPAHLELLPRQLSPREAAGRTNAFIIGGEALLGENLSFWQTHAPETVLVNEYGPTETVVGCCVYFVPKGKRFDGPVPIGRPIANTQLYVLDPHLQPVPVGAKGELYIGGDGVARGYLNLPELTAKSFILNPFAGEDTSASAKLYKTGDLVRHRPDGNLEFLGRVDHQVKIRGYRIEPAEIESVLAAHPQVQGSAVVARESRTGEKYLAAYVVGRKQPAPSISELRHFLKEKLPDYMVPGAFVTLTSFPLTPNGKVDRKALPPPSLDSLTSSEYLAPRTEIERKMAEVWQEMLERPRVGLHESFFDLGGHSLLAVRLIGELNRVFNANLQVITLFEHFTIATLAQALQGGKQLLSGPKLVTLESSGGAEPPIFFISAPMEVFTVVRMARHKHPFYISEAPLSAEVLTASAQRNYAALPGVAEMAAPHTSLIRGSSFSGSCILAGFSYGGVLAFEVAHQLQRHGISVEAVFLFDSDMKESHAERIKRHLRNSFQCGPGYLWRKIRELLLQQRQEGTAKLAARQALAAPAASLDFSRPEVTWEHTRRIWLRAMRNYQPRPIASRGFLFRAQDSIYAEVYKYDERLGWGGLFAGGLENVEVPGDHLSMWKEPHVRALNQSWETALQKLRRTANALLCSSPPIVAAILCSV